MMSQRPCQCKAHDGPVAGKIRSPLMRYDLQTNTTRTCSPRPARVRAGRAGSPGMEATNTGIQMVWNGTFARVHPYGARMIGQAGVLSG